MSIEIDLQKKQDDELSEYKYKEISMIEWLIENKEWLLSGILVSVPIACIGWYISKSTNSKQQTQYSGDNSRNFQAGKNIKISTNKNDK